MKKSQDDPTLPRWRSATWINLLVEKHAWLSAGLIWLPEASATGKKAMFSGEPRACQQLTLRRRGRAAQIRGCSSVSLKELSCDGRR